MGIFSRLLGGKSEPAPSGRVLSSHEILRFGDGPLFACCICGAWLGSDPDDSLHAEGPNRHLCGGCYRTREWEAIVEFESLN